MTRWRIAASLTCLAAAACLWTQTTLESPAIAASPTAASSTAAHTILDTDSVWRIFTVLKPPLIQYDAGPKPLTSPYEWVDKETPAPPEGWNSVSFDDDSWLRTNATGEPKTPYAANLFLRGRFDAPDPAAVKDLKLSLAYHGGVIVYLNGQEVGRGNLAKDAKGPTALAEPYPSNAFVGESGKLLGDGRQTEAVRDRKLDVTLPADKIRKGTNVLALEVIRAPYDKAVADYWKRQPRDTRELGEKTLPYDLNWYTCQVTSVKLVGAGSPANDARPKGVQVWNSNVLVTDTPAEYGDLCKPLQPVRIEGAKNGWYSGKVVLGSSKPIEGLKVTCPDMKQGSAVIPASAMRARYGVAFEDQGDANSHLETLLEQPLDSFPVANTGGAVVPVWFTVKIPASAKAGEYTGTATIAMNGEKDISVPITLQVADYTLPDTQDYRTWIELMQSPDTLAAEYHVPLWSDAHWALIAQSMRYIGEIGSRTLQIPLIAQTNSGNAESMVRWIKKPDGTYSYDFSIMDKYLDYAEKYMGKPKIVAFIAWEIYLDAPKAEVKLSAEQEKLKGDVFATGSYSSEGAWAAARWNLRDKGPAVTAYDPATKQTATVNLPRYEDPAAVAAWKPLFDHLHRDMAKRGLEKTMLLGMASDKYPNTKEMQTLEKVSGNLPWIDQGHGGNIVGSKLDGIAPIAYQSYVWNSDYPKDPDKGRSYGWKRPQLYVEFRRGGSLSDWPLPATHLFEEIQITGGQRGLGRVGADFWPVLKDKRGERRGWVWSKYPQSMWHSCQLTNHMLDPGLTGPVANAHYEALRDGIQECEARISIENVLTTPALKSRLDSTLATSAQGLLDNRVDQELKAFSGLQLSGRVYTTYTRYYNIFYYNAGGAAGSVWYTGSDWLDHTQDLYKLAGEVTKKADTK